MYDSFNNPTAKDMDTQDISQGVFKQDSKSSAIFDNDHKLKSTYSETTTSIHY